MLHVEADGREFDLPIVGQVHQQDSLNVNVRGLAVAVVDLDTMFLLRGHDRIDTLYLTVDEQSKQSGFLQETRIVADVARDRLERAGYTVSPSWSKVPRSIRYKRRSTCCCSSWAHWACWRWC